MFNISMEGSTGEILLSAFNNWQVIVFLTFKENKDKMTYIIGRHAWHGLSQGKSTDTEDERRRRVSPVV